MEFLIKWKGQSHLHCQWKPFSELQNVSNFLSEMSVTISLLCVDGPLIFKAVLLIENLFYVSIYGRRY